MLIVSTNAYLGELMVTRLLLFCLTFLFINDAMASTYLLIDEWSERRASENFNGLIKALKSHHEMGKQMSDYTVGGFAIEGNKVLSVLDDDKLEEMGRIIACDGLQGRCLVVDDLLKLYIPSDFSVDKTSAWTWENYEFSVTVKGTYSLLGQQLNVAEIIAFCETCHFQIARFEYDTIRGITSIRVQAEKEEGSVLFHFLLSDSTGFFAKTVGCKE